MKCVPFGGKILVKIEQLVLSSNLWSVFVVITEMYEILYI